MSDPSDHEITYADEVIEKLRNLISYAPEGNLANTCCAYLGHALDQIESERKAITPPKP